MKYTARIVFDPHTKYEYTFGAWSDGIADNISVKTARMINDFHDFYIYLLRDGELIATHASYKPDFRLEDGVKYFREPEELDWVNDVPAQEVVRVYTNEW